MDQLKSFVAEQNKKKSKISLSSSSASNKNEESAGLLDWMQSSVSISMPGTKTTDKDESSYVSSICPALSRTQRLIGCVSCVVAGIFCFSLSTIYVPVLLLKARKFALLFSLGSLFMINSFSFLLGPWNHAKSLFSKERLIFTVTYFGSLFSTLYFALYLKSTVLTTIAAVLQVIALLWYLVSYVPGGQTGLTFMTKIFTKLVTKSCNKGLPI